MDQINVITHNQFWCRQMAQYHPTVNNNANLQPHTTRSEGEDTYMLKVPTVLHVTTSTGYKTMHLHVP